MNSEADRWRAVAQQLAAALAGCRHERSCRRKTMVLLCDPCVWAAEAALAAYRDLLAGGSAPPARREG